MLSLRSQTLAKKFILFQRSVLGCLVLSLIGSCIPVSNQSRQTSKISQVSQTSELTISAAASMQDVLLDIEKLYEQQSPKTKLTFNFGSSGSLQHQIEQGAPIDIFISAAPQQMDRLGSKRLLLANTRQNLVKNQLVLIVPKSNQSIAGFTDLAQASTKQIALGEPSSVPAGQYAQELLASLNLAVQTQAKSVYAKNVRQVLNYVVTGNVDAGIVYRTDVANNVMNSGAIADPIKIVAVAPPQSHSPVVYSIAVIKDTQNSQTAQKMLKFLFTPKAQAIFRQHDFGTISNQQSTGN